MTTAAAPVTLASEGESARRALDVARIAALGVLGDRETAADVAQEVALRAVRRRHTLRDPSAFDAWVRRIAIRAALKEAERGRRRRRAETEHAAQNAGRRSPAPDEPRLAEALAALAGLPPRQRAAVTLRYVHDLSDAEIARALRCRRGTVRSLLSRGREAVRLNLEEDA